MTELETALSRIVKTPVKLIDYIQEIAGKQGNPTVYRFSLEAISDANTNQIPAENDIAFWGIPDVEKILFSPPHTIVFWEDGSSTIVKCMKGQQFDSYTGFAMACMKKMFGSTSRWTKIMKNCDKTNRKDDGK